MKTADEIKKGLECCWAEEVDLKTCSGCPYNGMPYKPIDCEEKLGQDALALIRQLEERVRQLEAERDVAVADLRRAMHCPSCANWKKPEKAAVCFACQYGRARRFEWRGVQKEE